MKNPPIRSFRGVLPQLSAGVIALGGLRDPSGLWGDDAWLTAKALEGLLAYQRNVEEREGLRSIVAASIEVLVARLKDTAAKVEEAGDLYSGLPERLRAMCASYVVLHAVGGNAVKDALAEIDPSLLKLLDSAAQYAPALGDIVVACEVIRSIDALRPSPEEARAQAKPWLLLAVRTFLAGPHDADRLRAMGILLWVRERAIASVAQEAWSEEAYRIHSEAKGLPLDEGVTRYAEEVLQRFRPSDLEDICVVIEARRSPTADLRWRLPHDLLRLLVGDLQDMTMASLDLGPAARAQVIGPMATAVKLLAESTSAQAITYDADDEERVAAAAAQHEELLRKRSFIIGKGKYRVLEAIAFAVVCIWALTFGWYNRDIAWVGGLIVAAAGGLLLRFFPAKS